MKGDYYRYLAEVAVGERRKEIMDQSQAAYKGAFEVAQKEMPVSFPSIFLILHDDLRFYFSQHILFASALPSTIPYSTMKFSTIPTKHAGRILFF